MAQPAEQGDVAFVTLTFLRSGRVPGLNRILCDIVEPERQIISNGDDGETTGVACSGGNFPKHSNPSGRSCKGIGQGNPSCYS